MNICFVVHFHDICISWYRMPVMRLVAMLFLEPPPPLPQTWLFGAVYYWLTWALLGKTKLQLQ